MEGALKKIAVLDQNTIDKIAAGEVVERPSSVVKELVENAIDAGATAVTVEITDGGKKLIRITDNGSGMESEQIPLAFLRHATSKIEKVEDLEHIASLGFRGEALSSIAAVGQVELITKTMKERYGDSGKPVFLGGDMNATPSSETGKLLQKDWEILTITGFGTFPSDNPSKCIDYIMQLKGTPKCEVVGSQILRWFKSGDVTKASDHLPVMLDIKLPAKNK